MHHAAFLPTPAARGLNCAQGFKKEAKEKHIRLAEGLSNLQDSGGNKNHPVLILGRAIC